MCEGGQLKLSELQVPPFNFFICETAVAKQERDSQTDSKLYYPNQ